MMVSTKGRYALRVMLDLAQRSKEGFISLKDISARQNVSMKYLESIVSVLNKAGFVQSSRGKDGGYKLTKTPSDYTVNQILTLTEGSLAPVSCLENCSDETCSHADMCLTLPMWHQLDSIINNYLEGITLEDLISGKLE